MAAEFLITIDIDASYEDVYGKLETQLDGVKAPGPRAGTFFWRGNHMELDHHFSVSGLCDGNEWIGFPYRLYVLPVEEPRVSLEHQVDLAEALMQTLSLQGYHAHLLADFIELVDPRWHDV